MKNVPSFVNGTSKPVRIAFHFMICLHYQYTNSNFISGNFNGPYKDECMHQPVQPAFGRLYQECNASATKA